MLRLASFTTILWLLAYGLGVGVNTSVVFAASQVDVFTFNNAEEEARYRRLIAEIRCPKCMNTNIAGSDATSAQTLVEGGWSRRPGSLLSSAIATQSADFWELAAAALS